MRIVLSGIETNNKGAELMLYAILQEIERKYPNAEVFVVSLDLPFAQGRFCSIEGIQNVVALSDFKNKAFGESYGVILAGSPLEGLLTRAVFVVNPEGKVVHKEIVSEVTNEPNYDAALAAVK